MSNKFKAVLLLTMLSALFFGFLHHFYPGETYSFERLHIFLFNLCSGGTIILYFTEDKKNMSPMVFLFFILAGSYAILAFLKLYIPAMAVSLLLALIIETARIRRFSFFPLDFFKASVSVRDKFHQASLLCLSIGLVISTLVILNNEYLKLISMKKLQLDTFFLGFSFPVSLITMSVIFGDLKKHISKLISFLKDMCFWFINLGVIIFFMFILFEKLVPQMFVTAVLFAAVITILYLFKKYAIDTQQKVFLISGLGFLLVTAVTGIAYIVIEFMGVYTKDIAKLVLRVHSFASLYGWNLMGLSVICRYHDFPIKLDSRWIVLLHWGTILMLGPLGNYYIVFAIITMICYAILLQVILFGKGSFNFDSISRN
ncbi:MAG: hypothetical protein GY754_22130 [bacterium]|nr:hypothetical protein [bacterium]